MSHPQDSPARIWQIHSLSFSHCTSLHDPLCAHVLNLVSAQDSTSLWLFGSPFCQCWKFTWNGWKWKSHMTQLCTDVGKYTRWSTYRRSITPYITCNCVWGTESNPCTWIAVMDTDIHFISVSPQCQKPLASRTLGNKSFYLCFNFLWVNWNERTPLCPREYVTAKQVYTVRLPCKKHSIVVIFNGSPPDNAVEGWS